MAAFYQVVGDRLWSSTTKNDFRFSCIFSLKSGLMLRESRGRETAKWNLGLRRDHKIGFRRYFKGSCYRNNDEKSCHNDASTRSSHVLAKHLCTYVYRQFDKNVSSPFDIQSFRLDRWSNLWFYYYLLR